MAQDNVALLAEKGLIPDPEEVHENAKRLLNELTAEEVGQLVSMWERVGKPDLSKGIHYPGIY